MTFQKESREIPFFLRGGGLSKTLSKQKKEILIIMNILTKPWRE